MTNPLLRHSSRRKELLLIVTIGAEGLLSCRWSSFIHRNIWFVYSYRGKIWSWLIETVQLKRSHTLGSYRQVSPLLQQDTCQQRQPQRDQVQPFSCFSTPWPREHPSPNRGGLQPLYGLCPLTTPPLVTAVILVVLYPSICVVSDWHPNKVTILKSHTWKSDWRASIKLFFFLMFLYTSKLTVKKYSDKFPPLSSQQA